MIWHQTTWQDFRYALRGMRLNPGFALTAILSLALGLGASLSIFTVADNLLLRPLPYRDPSQLVMVWDANYKRNTTNNVISPGNYLDWKAQNDVFEGMAAFREVRSVLNDGSRVEELGKQLISANLLPLLGVQPIRGRLFTEEEDRPNPDTVLLISYRLWQNWFGGDESIIGRKVQVNATPRQIIGVLPPGFAFRNRTTDLWEPIGLNPATNYRKTQGRWMYSVARIKSDVTLGQAQAQMTSIASRLESAYPEFNQNWTINLEPLRDSMIREVKTSMLVLLGAVGLLLAVSCANVANLLLARFASRQREMAIRGALGAGRSRIVRQLLTESVVLGLAGGGLGLLATRWAVMGLMAMAPADLTRFVQISIDLRIVSIGFGLSILTGIIFGLAPALVASRLDLNRSLREDSRSSFGRTGHLRTWLVAAEVALSVVLLAGAGLLFRTMIGLQAVEPGLDPANLLTFRVSIPAAKYADLTRRTQFFASALERISQLPGVRSASAVSFLPFNGMAAGTWIGIGGRPAAKPGEELISTIRTVMPGYFRTIGIPLRNGRDFTAADNTATSPYYFIVNEAFVRKYLPNENPLGTRINALMDRENPFGEIIGVVGDVKEGALDKEPTPTVYYVHRHLVYSSMTFVVRTASDSLTLAEPVRKIILGLDPEQPIAEVRTMEEIVRETFARQRFSAVLLTGFSIASLLLAAVGVYGVLACSVSARAREIGVRVALGARPGNIILLIVGGGARPVIGGALAGLSGAFALSGMLKTLLFGVAPRDPATFIVAPAILVGIALLAAFLPARRAARIDPMEALRTE
jgi:putative ABC transport system permease protein